MQVTLTSELESYVETWVASGDYDTREEVVEAGLALLQRREAERARSHQTIRTKIASGLDQVDRGEVWDSDDVFADLLVGSLP